MLDPILVACASAGVTLSLADDGETPSAGPRSAMTDELRAMLREHKAVIVAHLQAQQWEPAKTLTIVRDLATSIRAWRAVADVSGIAASAVAVAMATEAIQQHDTALLRDALACHEDAYAWWCDQALPVVATDTAAQRWACSTWLDDAPELLGGQSHYVFDDEAMA
ncbi:MAG: hypothetical protein JWO59_716 [Chloroflexi bacterium]|nr:hypothetical protein [Chloroflexota bacterium]